MLDAVADQGKCLIVLHSVLFGREGLVEPVTMGHVRVTGMHVRG